MLRTCGALPENAFGLASEAAWARFMEESLPALREGGWQIGFDEEFRHHSLRVDAWEADLVASDSGWFNLDMGIIVEGDRLPLAPLLASLFQRDSRWLETVDGEDHGA